MEMSQSSNDVSARSDPDWSEATVSPIRQRVRTVQNGGRPIEDGRERWGHGSNVTGFSFCWALLAVD